MTFVLLPATGGKPVNTADGQRRDVVLRSFPGFR